MSTPSRIKNGLRFFATARHLKFQQLVYQVWYRLRKRELPTTPDVQRCLLKPHSTWVPKADSWEPGKAFTFLNHRRPYSGKVDWHDAGAEKLWLYNLHYFDFIRSSVITDQTVCNSVIAEWIDANTNPDRDAWEPYPVSLRIVNWIKYDLDTGALDEHALNSLAQQAQWLSGGLEYHILANHLFANAKALVFAGVFFEGMQAERWLRKGVDLINAQLKEQILEDGGHYERSPMYHAIILEDVLDLVNIAIASNGKIPDGTLASWKRTAAEMCDWYQQMLHPDDDIVFFNDAAFGIAATASQIVDYARALDIDAAPGPNKSPSGSVYLEPTGFAVLRTGEFTLFANAAQIAPSYQPGHAHADCLSCELCVGRERVFVNSGTSTYLKGDLRNWQRSTAAHNTVEINGFNSSDTWDGFRVARRARVRNVRFSEGISGSEFSASHDGYRHLAGAPTHHRFCQLNADGLQVVDSVEGRFDTAVLRWLIHPNVAWLGGQSLRTADGVKLTWSVEGGRAEIRPAYWYPQFGLRQETNCLEVVFDSERGNRVSFKLWRD